jgi:hypothetical protein
METRHKFLFQQGKPHINEHRIIIYEYFVYKMSKDTSSPTKAISALDDYVLLGNSGLRVSPLCLGTMVIFFINLANIMT